MRSGLTAFLFSTLVAASIAHAEPIKVQRLDDSYIDIYVDPPAGKRRVGILLVLQGSECTSVDPDGDRFPYDLPPGIVRLDIQKYGIAAERARDQAGDCPAEYLANNTIDGRVTDVLTVLSWLRTHAGWWDGRLFLAGASEGSTVAAIAGALSPATRGIILINGSIGRPFRDGWSDAVAAGVSARGGNATAVSAARDATQAVWKRARETPTVETYEGKSNTLRWWRSIIDLRPLNLLRHLRVPILLMQSERDEMTPVSSARVAAAQLSKTNPLFRYIELPGLDHGFKDVDDRPQYQMVIPKLNAALAEQVARSKR